MIYESGFIHSLFKLETTAHYCSPTLFLCLQLPPTPASAPQLVFGGLRGAGEYLTTESPCIPPLIGWAMVAVSHCLAIFAHMHEQSLIPWEVEPPLHF
jgi:hypothetical protein